MARQPKTRTPKRKFSEDKKIFCRICKSEVRLIKIQGIPRWACSVNINH